MPSVDLATLSRATTRPLLVAIAHLPILIVVLCMTPIWIIAVLRPSTRGALALRLVKELRLWSRDVMAAVSESKAR